MNAKRWNRVLLMTLIASLLAGMGWFPQAAQAESAYTFSSPYGISSDEDGMLYVTDITKNAVFVLDSDGNLIRTLGTPGTSGDSNSSLNYPTGVAVEKVDGDHKRIYVLDAGNKRIQIFDETGSYLDTWVIPNSDGGVEDIKIGNGKVYVVSQNFYIHMFNPVDGTVVSKYIYSLMSNRRPVGLAIGADGRLYITGAKISTTTLNSGIYILDSNANSIVETIDIDSMTDNSSRLAMDRNGKLYVTDMLDYAVKIYDSDGTPLLTLGTPGMSGTADNMFKLPKAAAIDQDGKIYVTDLSDHKVKVFAADGTYITSYPPQASALLNATASPGTTTGTTAVTITSPLGTNNYWAVKVSSSSLSTPNVGDATPTGEGVTNPFTPGTDIGGVDATTNKYVGVYEVDANGKIVSFKLITLTEEDIKQEEPPVAAPVLDAAAASPGSAVGTTTVTVDLPAAGSTYAIRISDSPLSTPNVGDAVPTGAGVTNPFTPGTDIGGVDATTNKYVGVYEVDANGKIVSFKLITLTEEDIKQEEPPIAAPVLDAAAASPGSAVGTTTVTVDSPAASTYAIRISDSPLSTPNVGDAVPTGEGVTNPFTPGTDIGGVDATTNKYVGVYEVDANGKIVSFKQITLTEGDIKQAVVSSVPTTAPASIPVNLAIKNADNTSLTQLNSKLGSSVKLEGELLTADGKTIPGSSIKFAQDGTITMTSLAPGVYKVVLSIVAPDGRKLVGNTAAIIVDANGNASMESDLVDPFGVASDSITGESIDGMHMTLYWADTELNRSKGRVPDTVVELPLLPDMLPNQNNNPQTTRDGGQYGWMVYAEGDYYFTAEQDGYITYDSRNDKREELHGDTSYIRDGIIHVGESIVRADFDADAAVVETGFHTPYLYGYPDKEFKPELGITRAEMAAILARILPQGDASPSAVIQSQPYTDVADKYWAFRDIAYVRQLGIMNGTPGNKFNASQALTRAEFAQILFKLSPSLPAKGIVYTDTGEHWAKDVIDRVTGAGLMDGYEDGSFKPNAPVTRAEAAAIINNYLQRKPVNADTSRFIDVPAGYWAASDIAEASLPHHYSLLSNGWEVWEPEESNAN
ncbi:S-layer homology domain-containing protein [Cohnella fermenti]|uniref:SLH domain-containing protein n=1 Tax=Cohnella fermenti TaxID=2565925 RepID=A0A4S4BF86_9BACL|nr:S-layer homology domain-containing protein [Cohnella fermenti]THF72806.1 hypothetical protein E6C55_31855 [Cohnella fermenti]